MPKTDQLPHALYTSAQVRDLDRLAIEQFEIPGLELMRRAGTAAFDLLYERWPAAQRILVLCGPGNNGGDGYVVARLAHEAGMQVQLVQVGDAEKLGADARQCRDDWESCGGECDVFERIARDVDVIVDALLGIGLQRAPSGEFARVIEAVNVHHARVLAVDVPSGLDADSGAAPGLAVRADVTLSFIGLKRGLFTGDAVDLAGDVRFDALEVPARVYASQILSARRIAYDKQQQLLSPRRRSAHKGHFGHVLVVGGDQGFGGAALLAAEAAARCGAGLVSVATRSAHVPGFLAARPELMVHACDHSQPLEALLQQASVVVLGPGLGRAAWGREMFAMVMASHRPMVVDADALNQLAEAGMGARENWVLTPHPGEAGRLLQTCVADLQADRFAAAQALQQRYGGTLVLKGAGTLVQGSGPNPPALCNAGNPGMASGGMGDVLSGVIGALLAQGFLPTEAAELGVCLHAAAADSAAAEIGERGLLASDLMPYLHARVNP